MHIENTLLGLDIDTIYDIVHVLSSSHTECNSILQQKMAL